MRRIPFIALAAFTALTASACKKKEAAPAADTAAATPTPPPAPAPSVGPLELGRHLAENKRITDTTSTFAPRDTFYLSVLTQNTAPGSMLTAKWTFQTGQLVDSTVQAVAPPSPTDPMSVTEFHLVKPGGWPVGKYKVEVWLDNVLNSSREFEVRK